jgi:hypothetical protein
MAQLSITTAWNEAAAFVRREGRLLFPIAFGLVALPFAMMQALMPPPAPNQTPEAGAWLIMLPVVVAGSIVGSVAIMDLALRPGTSVGEALARGARRFLPLFAVSLAVGFVLAILFFIVVTIVVMLVPGAMQAASAGVPNEAMARVMAITLLVLLPAFLFIATRCFMITPVAAAEEGGPIAIIGRSWRLTAGHGWKLAAFLVLVAILWIVISLSAQAVFGSLIILLAGPLRPGSATMLLIILVGAILTTFAAVYMYSLTARIYAQLSGPNIA